MKKLLVLGFLFLATGMLSSQELGAIRGTVTDAEMQYEPLLFADVALKDSRVKVQTNLHGNFEITDLIPGNYILVINYLGYESLEIPVEINGNEIIVVNKALRAKSILPAGDTASLTASK